MLPDIEQGQQYDLREYYYHTRTSFFLVVALGPVFDSIRRGLQAGSFTDFGSISNLVSALLVGSLAISRNSLHHAIITLAVTGLFLFFIVSEALKLAEAQQGSRRDAELNNELAVAGVTSTHQQRNISIFNYKMVRLWCW